MKIKFIQAPKGRDYKVGETVDFKGPVEQTYAMKFIQRGWAEPVDEAAIKASEKAAREAQEKIEGEARAAADAKAKVEAATKAQNQAGATDQK